MHLSWKFRLAILSSIIWAALIAVFAGQQSSFSWSGFIGFGLLPLIAVWGVAWVIHGFRSERKKKQASPKPKEEKNVRPWVRFAARVLDYSLFTFIFALILVFVWPSFYFELFEKPSSITVAPFITTFFWALIEPIFISKWGTTPGKALLRVSVIKSDGSDATYSEASKRSFSVWFRGVALGLPFIQLFTMYFAYSHLKNEGITTWDKNYRFTVRHDHIGWLRGVIAISLLVGVLILSAWQSVESKKHVYISETWTNPTTFRQIQLPTGWYKQTNTDNSANSVALATFASAKHDALVVLARERLSSSVPLIDYAKALQNAKKRAMDSNIQFNQPEATENVAFFTGELSKGFSTYDIDVMVWTDDNKLHWHTVLIAEKSNREAQSDVRKLIRDLKTSTGTLY